MSLATPATVSGVAIVAHPHPLFGGTMDNKVVTTLARALVDLGYATARFNFRGVGKSEGTHDEGRGETLDCIQVIQHLQKLYPSLPLTQAGFSFGGAVSLAAAKQMAPQRLLLVAPAFSRIQAWTHDDGVDLSPPASAQTAIIHGDKDDVVPVSESNAWCATYDLPLMLVPNADHFFHQRLHHIQRFARVFARL